MRSSPTFAYLGWGALAVGIVIGCSSPTVDEPTADDLPNTPAKVNDGDLDGGDDTPDFEANFKDGGTQGSKKDASSENLNCIDPDDPGSAETVAKSLPDTNDCDNSFKTVHGVADGPVDVDFYRLSAIDEGISTRHPVGCDRETDFSVANANMEMCVFVACQNSAVDAFKGCSKGNYAESDLKMKGCCVEGPGNALPDWDCRGVTQDDSAVFFIRMRQIKTAQCLPYKFSYRF